MGSSLFKVIGGSLLTIALVWALVLGWWQSNDYQPSRIDLALYLCAMPLALIGGYFLLRGFIEHLKAPSPTREAVPNNDDPLASERAVTEAAERSLSVCLVDSFLCTPAGNSANEVLSAIAAGQRPKPNMRQQDAAGFPVFMAEVASLEVDAMRDKLQESTGAIRKLAERDDYVRTLALVDKVLSQAKDALTGFLEMNQAPPSLNILWLVSREWEAEHFPKLSAWQKSNYWPDFSLEQLKITLVPIDNEADALGQVDEIILRVHREQLDNRFFLLLGAISATDEGSIETWAERNQLFSATYQQRKIPGEGAAALLFAARPLAQRLHLESVAEISRVNLAVRDKAVDAGGRISGKLIEQLISDLLDICAEESSRIKAAIIDGDHRTGPLTEALEGLAPAFGHLDPACDCPATGSVNGALPPMGSLIALACARAKAITDEAPILCISNQHELARAVLLARPPLSPALTDSSCT